MNKFLLLSSFLFIFSFYSYANDNDSESKNGDSSPIVDEMTFLEYAEIIRRDKNHTEGYFIDLLKSVFPLGTATKYPSLKAKRQLDYIVNSIN